MAVQISRLMECCSTDKQVDGMRTQILSECVLMNGLGETVFLTERLAYCTVCQTRVVA